MCKMKASCEQDEEIVRIQSTYATDVVKNYGFNFLKQFAARCVRYDNNQHVIGVETSERGVMNFLRPWFWR